MSGGDVDESRCAGERFDGARRCGVVVLDRTAAAVTQQACGQLDNPIDDRHPVRPPEQGVRRIMFGHFGFQCGAVGNVGRVGDDEVHLAVERCEQPRRGDVGLNEFDRRACGVSSGVGKSIIGVVDGDDAGIGPVRDQRERQGTGTGAEVDDDRTTATTLAPQPIPAVTPSPVAG